jgi:hypothetical protein
LVHDTAVKIGVFSIAFDYLWRVIYSEGSVRLYLKYFCAFSEVKAIVSIMYPHFLMVSVCTFSSRGLLLFHVTVILENSCFLQYEVLIFFLSYKSI